MGSFFCKSTLANTEESQGVKEVWQEAFQIGIRTSVERAWGRVGALRRVRVKQNKVQAQMSLEIGKALRAYFFALKQSPSK